MDYAIDSGNVDQVIQLLDSNADVNGCSGRATYLQRAAMHGHTEVVRILADRNATLDTTAGGQYGFSALHWACFKDFRDIVRELLERGASVNVLCDSRDPPLHPAVFKGNESVAMMLIDAGADLNLANVCHTTHARSLSLGLSLGTHAVWWLVWLTKYIVMVVVPSSARTRLQFNMPQLLGWWSEWLREVLWRPTTS
jgi:hypothetical protein